MPFDSTCPRWGEGFATEVGQAALDVAFGPLNLDDVVAFTLPHNGASRRVMEKLGFEYEKTAPYKVYGDHVLYRAGVSRTTMGHDRRGESVFRGETMAVIAAPSPACQ